MRDASILKPGPIVLFGSGETTDSGRKIFDWVFSRLPDSPRVSLLETPAGFELNSDRVAGRVADFLSHRLQNYHPQIQVIPARKRGTPFSPDNPEIAHPLLEADMLFLGAGSPSYAVRQLENSRVWQTVLARFWRGAALVLASAAAIAISEYALPVYEIYKVGEDVHWKPGLDFFGALGLPLVVIPHWNNREGGDELDTRRCFMGVSRYETLSKMLPPGTTVIGIDERTALVIDLQAGKCETLGDGGVSVIRHGQSESFTAGQPFPLSRLGSFQIPPIRDDIPLDVWQEVLNTQQENVPEGPPAELEELVDQREAARNLRDWEKADALREEIEHLGWQVQDAPDGPRLIKR